MKSKVTTTSSVLLFAGAALAVSMMIVAAPVSAADKKKGHLHVTKECSQYSGAAGGYCTITSSSLAAIAVGAKVFYTQDPGIVAGLLDSNVVLDAGDGNRALGRCTLDFATGLGLCTFSDGIGKFAGFRARVDVSFLGGSDWGWEGTYRFNK